VLRTALEGELETAQNREKRALGEEGAASWMAARAPVRICEGHRRAAREEDRPEALAKRSAR